MSKRLETFEKMIASGSKDPFVWYARAMELRSIGRNEDALAAYAEVEQKFPDYVATYLMAGQVARQLGQHDVARGYFERGVACAERVHDAHAASELRAELGT